MASLDDIRMAIIPVDDSKRNCEEVVDGEVVGSKEEWTFDDEDFWEALDLMETSCKAIHDLLKHNRMSPSRRLQLENHCCDLTQFIGEFQAD